jgi:starch synthase (maltosyl-transferring)
MPAVRIVFCITELDPGGAERALVRLVTSLNRQDWDPYVISLGPRGELVDPLEEAGIPVTCLNAKGPFSLPRVLVRLTSELRTLRPKIMQTFLFHANILGRIAARFARVPIVVSGLRVAEHRSRWYGRIDRWTNSLVKMNICVSQGVALSESSVGLRPSKLVVIPNSVQAERFMNARPADLRPLGIPGGSLVFISIGRLDRQKGIDVLIDSLSYLESLDSRVHFLVVGDGGEHDALRRQAAHNRYADRVHFANRRDDIPQLLAASYALVLSSRWEGMPNVVLEAMAAGKPVIATRVEGIAELIKHLVNGLIVEPQNPQELAIAISWLLDHPQFASTAGHESQTIVQQQFTQDKITDAYLEIYLHLLGK